MHLSSEFRKTLPFDAGRLDSLLDTAGVEVLLVTSKHNIQYLFGGYRYQFFDHFDAVGISRYLPILIYPKNDPDRAAYIANAMEDSEAENGRFWCSAVTATCWGTIDAIDAAIKQLRALGGTGTIGVESAFMPSDAMDKLRSAFPDRNIIDAHLPLERLRAVKTDRELGLLRKASSQVVDAILETFGRIRVGMTKQEVVSLLRQNEASRDLDFEYCLITAGSSFNRAPSEYVIQKGDILSIDSGGCYQGYIGDLCRMGIVGTPDAELEDLLGYIEEIQQMARKPVRAGAIGREIYQSVDPLIEVSSYRDRTSFVAHGMGIIIHEAPRISNRGPVSYPAYDADLALQAGMVLSIETALSHPTRGYIKIEDTVAVTENGWEAFGDHGRGWNVAGQS